MKIKVKRPTASGGGVKKPIRKIGGMSNTEAAKTGISNRRPPKANGPGNNPVSSGGAFGRAKQEKKLQDLRRNVPYGVSVPIGGTLTVYLLDRGEPWYRYEHQVGASKTQRGETFPCIQDGTEPCPLCASEGKPGTYVMYLTCIVPVDRYTKQDGTTVTRRYQKKLFPIKVKMAGKYERLFKKRGTFRGQVLKLIRDGKLDPAIGNDFEELKILKESEIKAYAKGEGIKGLDRETKDFLLKANIDEPFEYDKVMPRPTAKELSVMAKVKSSGDGGGSIGDADFGDDDGSSDDGWGEDGIDDDVPF